MFELTNRRKATAIVHMMVSFSAEVSQKSIALNTNTIKDTYNSIKKIDTAMLLTSSVFITDTKEDLTVVLFEKAQARNNRSQIIVAIS